MIRLEHAFCSANQALPHNLPLHSSSQTGCHSPVGRLFQVLWDWACPNDWQAGRNSCKSGSATRVEPLHLSLWIHICTVHSTNYYKPSACTCVHACVHWSTMNTSVVMLFFFLIPLLFATRKDNVGYFARESGFIPRANRVFPLTSCDRSHDYITSSHRPLVQPVLVRYSSLFPQCWR